MSLCLCMARSEARQRYSRSVVRVLQAHNLMHAERLQRSGVVYARAAKDAALVERAVFRAPTHATRHVCIVSANMLPQAPPPRPVNRVVLFVACVGLLLVVDRSLSLSAVIWPTSAPVIRRIPSGLPFPRPEASSICTEPEASWCTVVDHYAKHPDAPMVEISYNGRETWFDRVQSSPLGAVLNR